jgi:hypothetical protein
LYEVSLPGHSLSSLKGGLWRLGAQWVLLLILAHVGTWLLFRSPSTVQGEDEE